MQWYPHKSYKMQCSDEHSAKVFGVSFILGTWEGTARCPLRGVHKISRISCPWWDPHDFQTTILDYSSLPQETHQYCLVSSAPKPLTMPLPHSSSWDLTSPPLTSHLKQVPFEASVRSGLKTSSQNLPNAKFQMVSTQNQESDQIFLKTGPVSFKTCYRLQQTESGFWLSCETWNHMCSAWFRFLLWISYTALRE